MKLEQIIERYVNEGQVLTSKKFADWYDNPKTYQNFKATLDKIHNIFMKNGFGPETNVDVAYSKLSKKEQEEITKLVRNNRSQKF